MSLIAELKRRKVFKVAAAYVVVAWLAIQVADTVFPSFGIPDWAIRFLTLTALLGFPLALILAWALDVTPEGIKVTTGDTGNKRFALIVLVVSVVAVGWYLRSRNHEAADDGVSHRSIAVLPFVNMSSDPNQEYFSDGISEELLNRLAQFTDLKVAARTSAFQFKGKNLDIGDIGRQLKVSHVLEGSVRKSGTNLRITAQLIDTESGYHLWSETYDRDATDIFKVQDEIAGAIAHELEARLSGSAIATTPARNANAAAYDDYLQGRSYVALRREENLDKAIAAFDRAIAHDPGYSAAHSGRAFAFLLRPMWGATDIEGALVGAKESADKALELDPDNAEAYMVRGMVAAFRRDPDAASADLDRARALAPGSVDVLNMDGDFRSSFAELGAAESEKRQAMALDPLAFVHPMNLSDILAYQGHFAESLVAADQSVALGAADYGYIRVAYAQSRLGRVDAAMAATKKICAGVAPTEINCLTATVTALAVAGKRKQAQALVDQGARLLLIDPSQAQSSSVSQIASLYMEVGNIPMATQWQRRVIEGGDWFPTAALLYAPGGAKLPEELSTDPEWLAAWADPRIKKVTDYYRRNLLAWRASR